MFPASFHSPSGPTFHSRTWPSLPAEDNIVLQKSMVRNHHSKIGGHSYPVTFHSTRLTADLKADQFNTTDALEPMPTYLCSTFVTSMMAHLRSSLSVSCPPISSLSSPFPSPLSNSSPGWIFHILTLPSRLPVAIR